MLGIGSVCHFGITMKVLPVIYCPTVNMPPPLSILIALMYLEVSLKITLMFLSQHGVLKIFN